MKLLFSSPSPPEVGLLKSLLDEAGIACEIRNQDIYPNFPGAAFQPEIWVIHEKDFATACEVRDVWRKSLAEQDLKSSSQDNRLTRRNSFFSALTGLLLLAMTVLSGVKLAHTGDVKFLKALFAGGLLSAICIGLAIALWPGQGKRR